MTTLAARTGGWLYNRPYLLLTITALSWSGNIIVGRLAPGHIPPVMLAQLRWTCAFVILLPLFLPQLRRDWPVIRRSLPILIVLAFFGITCFNTIAYIGLQYTQAINAALMQSTAPLWIALWSLILFRERLTAGQVAGIVLSTAGVLAIISRGDLTVLLHLTLNPGDILMITAMACYSLYAALLRRKPAIHPMSLIVVTIGLGLLLLLPATIAETLSGARTELDTTTLVALAYVVIFATIVAYIGFNRGVELIGANRAGPFFHLIPLFGSFLAIIFLGEHFASFHALGYVLILCGIALAQRAAR